MKFFDFWAFQNIKRMLSHDKIIFHMLFGAFHITPRIKTGDEFNKYTTWRNATSPLLRWIFLLEINYALERYFQRIRKFLSVSDRFEADNGAEFSATEVPVLNQSFSISSSDTRAGSFIINDLS